MQWFASPKGKRGRRPTSSDAAIQFCLSIKCLFILAQRQALGFSKVCSVVPGHLSTLVVRHALAHRHCNAQQLVSERLGSTLTALAGLGCGT